MANVTVRFAGVAAVGPARPRVPSSDQWQRSGPFYAVFPPSTRRKSVNNGPKIKPYVPFHMPLLATKLNPTADSRQPDEVSHGFDLWYPFRERLVFEPAPDADWKLQYQHEDVTPLPDGDVDLLADFRDIWPQVSAMPCVACNVHRPVHEVPALIHGQVFIPFGNVHSDKGNHDRKSVQFLPPRPGGATGPRDIVSDTLVTFPAESITIRSWSLDTGQELDPIKFDVKQDSTILIANADLEDIPKYLTGAKLIDADEENAGDADFELYYTLLAPGVTSNLPIPVDAPHAARNPAILFVKNCYNAMTDVME